jgi:hypothetical protein
VAVAQDVQGAEVAIPWMEKAKATYRGLLDQHNAIGNACNLKYVPVAIIVDEAGALVRAVGSVNIGDEEFRAQLSSWVRTGVVPTEWVEAEQPPPPRQLTEEEAEADARFQLALVLLKREKKEEALVELKKAVVLDSQNWSIRKQMWAVETPEAFYAGDVDYAWQKEQQRIEAEGLLKQ